MPLHVNIFSKTFLTMLSLYNMASITKCPRICCKISLKSIPLLFKKLGFSPFKAKQPLHGMDVQAKEEKDKKTHRKVV